jgi:hypothetical protein
MPGVAVTTDTPDIAYLKVLAAGGAFPWLRDTVDARVANQVLTETSPASLIDSVAEAGGYPSLPVISRPAGWDTDNDGMPNWWETARGLNPSVAGNNLTTLTPGSFTDLEHYLNYLTLFAQWDANASSTWGTILNWRGTLPASTDATAIFGSVITAPRTITVNAPHTVGQLIFDNTNAYTLAGASAITMDVISGTAFIDVATGSHTISAPLALADNTTFTITPAASTLTVSNLQQTTSALTKAGAGTMTVNNVRSGGLAVTAGAVKVLAGGGSPGTSRVTSLTISPGAKLDLADHDLIVTTPGATGSWTGSSYTGITALVASGRNGGAWDGSGIVTSDVRAVNNSDYCSLGIATASDALGIAATDTIVWSGQVVTGTNTLVKFTYGGDANLSGEIDIDDYGQIDFNASLGGTLTGWFNGDFDYSGSVDIDDYGIIDFNIGIQGPPLVSSSTLIAVPEASSISIL